MTREAWLSGRKRRGANPVAAVRLEGSNPSASVLPPDVQFDLRLQELADQAEELEALEHFEALRREADERAW